MMLNTKCRYAVTALVEMAGRNRFIDEPRAVSLADIADTQSITVAYLEQIFSKLRCAGLVRSQRGPGGGYIFAKPAEQITIAEIIDAVEEKIKMTRCGEETKTPCMTGKGKCSTHDLWDGLSETIGSYLESITLADVINKKVMRVENLEFRKKSLLNSQL